ncbi:MAG: hypothetical protein C0617_11240 [Desulfuromonas sp.]|uniref:hypothetical protein n=1 Tax=Desulfuromonas sp. TaxID=892 RepID=UPI000CB56D5E|nr:hypothetical protein [Desulfuromonas sp.]PLX83496.1 MAG: hypothetical protein C0617_11240 [Desulfuromonas sp.]
MEEGTLREVVRLEREIHRQLAEEQLRADEGLERLRRELEEEYEEQSKALAEALEQAVEEAKRQSEERAAGMLAESRRQAERLAAMSDEQLGRIVHRQIALIVPGEAHDRPDVEG